MLLHIQYVPTSTILMFTLTDMQVSLRPAATFSSREVEPVVSLLILNSRFEISGSSLDSQLGTFSAADEMTLPVIF